jgi:hypothetical protein
MGNRRGRPPDALARLFLDVTGELPDDASILRMRRVSGALNLRDNDALWSVLVMLEYYGRLYEAMPERIRQAGAGSLDAIRAETGTAVDALMAQHRDALARCKATIELAEQMISEHETRYRAALAELNGEALTLLSERAANRIAHAAGNRLVGAMAIAAREQRQRLDAAVASYERVAARRFARVCYGLAIGGLAGWWASSHSVRADGSPSARTAYASSVSSSMNLAAWPSMSAAVSFWSKAIIGAR